MAYNEALNIGPVAEELRRVLEALGLPYEVLMVDDGSTDGTRERVQELVGTWPSARAIHHRKNGGLGAVYRTGFGAARGALVTFFPADGQFPAFLIEQFVTAAKDADLVLGYLPRQRRPPVSRFLSAVERWAYRGLFGTLPRFQGLLMFRRELLDGVVLRSTGRGWTVLMEFIIKTARGGARTISIPTTVRSRLGGPSKVNNLRTIAANAYQLLVLRLSI